MQKTDFYQSLAKQAEGLISDEKNAIANMANLSALLFTSLDDVNWAGFYLIDTPDELVLGPFQGNPACIHIESTQLVEDVHAFAGHIACDAASNSEIVVPVFKNGEVFGVLDIDSPLHARFDLDDQAGLEQIVKIFEATL